MSNLLFGPSGDGFAVVKPAAPGADPELDRRLSGKKKCPVHRGQASLKLAEIFRRKFSDPHQNPVGGAKVQVGPIQVRELAGESHPAGHNGGIRRRYRRRQKLPAAQRFDAGTGGRKKFMGGGSDPPFDAPR